MVEFVNKVVQYLFNTYKYLFKNPFNFPTRVQSTWSYLLQNQSYIPKMLVVRGHYIYPDAHMRRLNIN
jgi:hypothetical protein